MQICGRGIRRGWAPMMRNDAQLRLSMSLLFSLPGSPMLIYGHELGTGDDLTREGRSTVRWTPGGNGGFTDRGRSGIVRAAKASGRYGNRRVNVQCQQGDEASLLELTRSLIALRHEHPEIGSEQPEIRAIDDSLLVLEYSTLSVVHNLSRRSRPLPELGGQKLIGDEGTGKGNRIRGYGFAWYGSGA